MMRAAEAAAPRVSAEEWLGKSLWSAVSDGWGLPVVRSHMVATGGS